MKIVKLWKDSGSGVTNCPALYEAEGGYVVQGVTLDDETVAQLDQLGPNDTPISVERAVAWKASALRYVHEGTSDRP